MALVWRDQLSVGNNVIDSDHKHLISIINLIEQCLAAKNRDGLDAALDDLYQYSLIHFAREELFAAEAGFTQVSRLAHSHHKLLDDLVLLRGELDAVIYGWPNETIARLNDFLRSWLIDHVIKEDLLLKPVLQRHSPTYDPR